MNTIDKIEQRFGDITNYNYIKFIGSYYKNKGALFVCATFYEFVKEDNGNITQLGMDLENIAPVNNIARTDLIDRIKQMELQGMSYNDDISCVDNNDNLNLAFCQ